MKVEVVVFVVFVIAAGVVSSVYGRPGPPENPPCKTKFYNDPLFFQLENVIEAIYKSMEIIQPNESSKLGGKKCETYSVAERMFGGISVGMGIIEESNCLRISEIDEAEKTTLLAAVEVVNNFFLGIRMIDVNNVDSGGKINESENEMNSKLIKVLDSIFQGLKTVLSKTCPENPLVGVKNIIDLLDVTEQEAISAANDAVNTLFIRIVEIYGASSKQLDGKTGRKNNFSVMDIERDKANEAMTQWVRDLFIVLKNSLSKIAKKA